MDVGTLLSYAIWEVLGTKSRQRVREWQRWNQRGGSGATWENTALLSRWGKWVRTAGRAAGVFERALADPTVEVQEIFLRRIFGASLPPNRQLFAETSQLPLHHFWAQQVFWFWMRLSKQPSWLEPDRSSSEHECFWAAKVLRILGPKVVTAVLRLGMNFYNFQSQSGSAASSTGSRRSSSVVAHTRASCKHPEGKQPNAYRV